MALREAIRRAEQGLIDADLGGGVIKQRIARPGQGRSGGFRTIVLYRSGERSFFVYGFPKSKRDSITQNELEAFRDLGEVMMAYTDGELDEALQTQKLRELDWDEQDL